MAKPGSEGQDNTLVMLFFFVLVAFALMALLSRLAPTILPVWAGWRALELSLVGDFSKARWLMANVPQQYGAVFTQINQDVTQTYRWLALIVAGLGIASMARVRLGWSMEDYLINVRARFDWLKLVVQKPAGWYRTDTFPFIKYRATPVLADFTAPVPVEPLAFMEQAKTGLSDALKRPIGQPLRVVKGQVQWSNPLYAKTAALLLSRIPEGRPAKDAPTWRESAWQRCFAVHRFERTLLMGLLEEARRFGSISATRFLYLKADQRAGNPHSDSSRILHLALTSQGGDTAFAEVSGLFNHFRYEKALAEYAREIPASDQETRRALRGLRDKIWVADALASFYELHTRVRGGPDSADKHA